MTDLRSTEDTLIGMQPSNPQDMLLANLNGASASDAGMIERCRSLFRSIGERVSSFDLSRQIYG